MIAFPPVRKGGFQSARVAELVDALDSGSSTRKGVQVRVLSRAPSHYQWVTGELPRPVDNPRYPMNEGGDKMVTNAGAGSAIRSSAKRSIPEGVAEILLHRKQYGASNYQGQSFRIDIFKLADQKINPKGLTPIV